MYSQFEKIDKCLLELLEHVDSFLDFDRSKYSSKDSIEWIEYDFNAQTGGIRDISSLSTWVFIFE